MRSETRIALVLSIGVLVLAPPIGAAPPGPAAHTSEISLLETCPADDSTVAPDLRPQEPTPETTQESLERWLEERARNLSSLVEERHPDGSVSVDLQEAFWSRIVMQRNADGSISIRCFPAGSRPLFATRPVSQPLETK